MKFICKKISKPIKAISPVIAVLLMIAIAVVASLVAYAWVMGYLGSTTAKVGTSIQVQSIAKNDLGNLVVYVQNVGDGSVRFDPSGCVYVNGVSKSCSISANGNPLSEGQTAVFTVDYSVSSENSIKIKVTTTDGVFAESTTYRALSSSSNTVSNTAIFTEGFESGAIDAMWTPYQDNGAVTVQNVETQSGTFAAQHALNNAANAYASIGQDLDSSYSTIYMRGYYRVSALPSSDQYLSIGNYITNSNFNQLSNLFIQNNGGTVQWRLHYLTNGYTENDAYGAAPTPQANTWYCIESLFKAGNGNGEVSVWINGVQVISVTGLTNSDYSATKAIVDFQSSAAMGAVSLYSDSIIVSQEYIGPN